METDTCQLVVPKKEKKKNPDTRTAEIQDL